MKRRVGRYTKQETIELLRMFEGGYSVYKICRNLNRSQKSIRNNLIRLGKMEGEITPRNYVVEGKDVIIKDENHFFENFKYFGKRIRETMQRFFVHLIGIGRRIIISNSKRIIASVL